MKKFLIIFSLFFVLMCGSLCSCEREQVNTNINSEFEEYVIDEYIAVKAVLPDSTEIVFVGADTIMFYPESIDSLDVKGELAKFISVFSAGDSIYCAVKDIKTGEVTIEKSECLPDKLIEGLDFSYLFEEGPTPAINTPQDSILVAESNEE